MSALGPMFDPQLPGKLLSFIGGIRPEKRTVVPEGETWCLEDIVTHIVDTEIQAYTRLIAILAEPLPRLENYDEQAWTGMGRRTPLNTAKALTLHTRTLVQQALRQSGYDRFRQGLHSERGPTSFVELAQLYDWHIEVHLRQAQRIYGKITS